MTKCEQIDQGLKECELRLSPVQRAALTGAMYALLDILSAGVVPRQTPKAKTVATNTLSSLCAMLGYGPEALRTLEKRS